MYKFSTDFTQDLQIYIYNIILLIKIDVRMLLLQKSAYAANRIILILLDSTA